MHTDQYASQRPGANNDVLKAFPAGFRMIAGNPFQRNYTGTFAAQAVSFVCLDYATTSPQYNGMPDINCPDGLRAQIFFPSCWDGVNLDSPDHSSHVSYPSSGAYNNGECPSTHPVHLISLFYEIIYQTGNFANDWYGSGQPFVFAQGDPTGYGFHGDFINGWNVPTLQNAVTNCNNLSGLITDCPAFDFFTDAESTACSLPHYVQENIDGPLEALPGCNPVQKGPGLATNHYATCNVKSPIALSEGYFTDVTPMGYEYIGCGLDSVSTRTLTGSTESSGTMTVKSCVSFCKSGGYKYAGLEYSSQ